jgi:hypothetical protein
VNTKTGETAKTPANSAELKATEMENKIKPAMTVQAFHVYCSIL